MALPDLGRIDPSEIAKASQELRNLVNREMPRLRPPLRQLGGFMGALTRNLQEATEETVFLSRLTGDTGIQKLADELEASLLPTLSFIERSAYRTRQAVKGELRTNTEYERSIANLQASLGNAVKGTAEYAQIQKDLNDLIASATTSDRNQIQYKKMLLEYERAQTDEQRENIQMRLQGFVQGEEDILRAFEDRLEREMDLLATLVLPPLTPLAAEEAKKRQEEIDLRQKSIDLLNKEIESLYKGIDVRKQGIERTVDQYKAGFQGFMGELLGTTFKGGLMGALKGEGFGDLFGNALMMGLDRTGILDKNIRGFNVASTLFGAESPEARRVAARAAGRGVAVREGVGTLASLGTAAPAGSSTPPFTPPGGTTPPLTPPPPPGGTTPPLPPPPPPDRRTGRGGFLSSISRGIASFGNRRVLQGAAALAIIGTAMIPFALGMKQLASIPIEGVASALLAMGGLTAVLFGISKIQGEVLKGALALGLIGIAMLPFAAAMTIMSGVTIADVGNLLAVVTGASIIAGIIGAIAATGVGAAAIAVGAVLLGLIGVALIPFAAALMMVGTVDPGKILKLGLALFVLVPAIGMIALMAPLLVVGAFAMAGIAAGVAALGLASMLINPETLSGLSNFFVGVAMNATGLFVAAGGILALAAAVAVFAGAGVVKSVGGAISGAIDKGAEMLGIGGNDAYSQIMGLAAMSGELMVAANALNTIASAFERLGAALGSFPDSASAMETIDKIVSLDATQIQTLQDVSLAMDKIMSANEQLRGERNAAQMEAAMGGGVGGNTIVAASNSGTSNMMFPAPSGRSNDPSILFSGERHYSMIYR